MPSIQIFDPALCCSTGVCGVEVDQNLVNFAADVDWAKQHGAQVERFNLAQQPLAFAENPTVKGFYNARAKRRCPWFWSMVRWPWPVATPAEAN